MPLDLVLALSAALAPAPAQDAEAKKILEAFETVRPKAAELGWYGLDWVATLKEARKKAQAEHRPICLIAVTNDFGNMMTGHC